MFQIKFILFFSFLLVIGISAPIQAMPPNPELLKKIQQGTAQPTYYMQHESELRAAGVDAPHRANLRTRHTDEINETNLHLLVLLVDFPDDTARTPASFYDSLVFGHRFGTVNDYYHRATYGEYNMLTYDYPSHTRWRRAPHPYSYYVNGHSGMGTYPQNSQGLFEDLLTMDDSLINFARYDVDAYGWMVGVIIVHAGTGGEVSGSSNDVHSHTWGLYPPLTLDGVDIMMYCIVPEFWLRSGDLTCGVFCHEMGHSIFGLPDLYDVDYTSQGIGRWSLMAAGSWNGGTLGTCPAFFDAFCRIRMGSVTPIVVNRTLSNIRILATEDTSIVYKLQTTTTDSEYFLVENRRLASYDSCLPSSGLLIYHVDPSLQYPDNNNSHEWYPGHTANGHYWVALEQADGRFDMERHTNVGDAGDPFPGSSYAFHFDAGTAPNSFTYNQAFTGVEVRNIHAVGPVITATLSMQGVHHAPALYVIAPNGGEQWGAGTTQYVQWTSDSNSQNVNIDFRVNPDSNWSRIFSNQPPFGQHSWITPRPTITRAQIRVSTIDSALTDISDSTFSIRDIIITAPNGGEAWEIGSNSMVRWQVNGTTSSMIFELNRSYPTGTWETVNLSIGDSGSYRWQVTGPVTDHARIRLYSANNRNYAESDSDFRIVPNTSIRTTGTSTIPACTKLSSAFPNPFNSSTIIEYSLAKNGQVKLELFDLFGREVSTLVNTNQNAGTHRVRFDGKNLSSGEYFYRLSSGNQIEVRKMILMK